MLNYLESFFTTLGMSPVTFFKIVKTLLTLLILPLLRYLILKIVYRRTKDVRVRFISRKTLTYSTIILILIIIGIIWIHGFKQLGTFIGLVSAGMVIALKEPITNFVGWLYIITTRHLKVGDRVQLGDFRGDVIDLRMFSILLLEIGNWVDGDQSTGRIISLPNSMVFNHTLANYSAGFQYIWDELKILVTFESDWKKAKEHLLGIAKKHAEHLTKSAEEKVLRASRKYMIFYKNLTPIVYTKVVDSGVLLTIRFLVQPRNRRNAENGIWEDILEAFEKEPSIEFAYPTQRFYRGEEDSPSKAGL